MDLEHLHQLIPLAGIIKGQEQAVSEQGVAETYSTNPQAEAQEATPHPAAQNPMMQSLGGLS